MGRRKTYVAATTVKMLSDTPDLTKDSVSDGAINGDRKCHTGDKILENYHNSVAIKASNYFNYGKRKYSLGLPQGSMDLGVGDDAKVSQVLEGIEGEPVTIVSNVLDYFKPEPAAYQHMQDNWGWNPDDNMLTQPPMEGKAEDSVFFYRYAVYVGNNQIQCYIQEFWKGMSKNAMRTATFTVPPYQPTDIFYSVIYQKQSGGQDQYWYYNEATGTYPSLDQPDGKALASPFYPIVPLRLHNKDMTRDEVRDTPLYQTSEEMLRKMDLNMDQVTAEVHENPDIDDVDHIFVMMGVNLQEESQAAIRYLTDFFLYLGEISANKFEAYDNWKLPDSYQGSLAPHQMPPQNLLTMEDSEFKIEIRYNYIETKVLPGVIGKLNHCTRECVIKPVSDYGTFQKEDSHVTFRKQVTETEYVEVVVSGLLHKNYVYNGHTIDTNVEDSLKEDENGFIIPLNWHVVKALPMTIESQLIYDSFQLVFNSYEVIKLKWYQTGIFKVIIVIVALVVSIYSGQWQVFFAALAGAGSFAALVMVLLEYAFYYFAMSYAFKILAKVIGPELAMILAVVAFAVSAGQAGGDVPMAGVPSAEALLNASMALSKVAAEGIQNDMEELLDEMEQFKELQEEQQKELDEIWDELNSPPELDPFSFVGLEPNVMWGETPSEFYDRTVHAGNIGVFSLDAIDNYVENAITLPSTNETLA